MKVLLVNGSPHEKGCTYTALTEVAKTLNDNGIETELYWIGNKPIQGCTGCGACMKKKECVFEDGVNSIVRRADEFDGFVFGSPVYYSGPDGQLCAFMDRLFYSGSRNFRGKVGAAIVNARRSGTTSSVERLNQYFLISDMIVPGSQYWNATHGFTPEDVMKDEEGMQTMRRLGQTMSWILKCIEAGKEKGIELPPRETWAPTHFIR